VGCGGGSSGWGPKPALAGSFACSPQPVKATSSKLARAAVAQFEMPRAFIWRAFYAVRHGVNFDFALGRSPVSSGARALRGR
jgi:hypothetical protein